MVSRSSSYFLLSAVQKKVAKKKPPRANSSSARPAVSIQNGPRLPALDAHVFFAAAKKQGFLPPPVARGTIRRAINDWKLLFSFSELVW